MDEIVVREAMMAGVLLERALCALLVYREVSCHMSTHEGNCPGLAVMDCLAVKP